MIQKIITKFNKMKKFRLFLVMAILVPFLSSCSYNTMVEKREAVTGQWAQVEDSYQRRMDLIGNLVETVKGAAKHENETLTAVINARANATKVTIDPTNLTEDNIKAYQMAQNNLTEALSKLMVVHEQYPDLKVNQNFLELQAQLEGTENRISVERKKFNTMAQDYNTTISTFPNNLIASMFGFEKQAYFKADEAAKTAPKVQF